MKLALILSALILIVMISAGCESVKINGFNVSYTAILVHNCAPDNGDGTNGSVKISTPESGNMIIYLNKFPKSLTLDSMWAQDLVSSLRYNLGIPAEMIEIDGSQGVIGFNNVKGKPSYNVVYYPDLNAGKANTSVSISSDMSFYATSDLIRTIHVAI
jgi:hypothetical protein